MALYLLQLRKAVNTGGVAYRWSNRYFTEQPTIQDALNQGLGWWSTYEATFHGELAFCYEIYANLVGDAPFTPGGTLAVPPGLQRGIHPQAGASGVDTLLPAFNVVRVDFPVDASRPSRKFYRIPLQEFDIVSGQLAPGTAARVQDGATDLAAEPSMRDIDGQAFSGTAVVRGITSRRLGRDGFTAVPPGPPFG